MTRESGHSHCDVVKALRGVVFDPRRSSVLREWRCSLVDWILSVGQAAEVTSVDDEYSNWEGWNTVSCCAQNSQWSIGRTPSTNSHRLTENSVWLASLPDTDHVSVRLPCDVHGKRAQEIRVAGDANRTCRRHCTTEGENGGGVGNQEPKQAEQGRIGLISSALRHFEVRVIAYRISPPGHRGEVPMAGRRDVRIAQS